SYRFKGNMFGLFDIGGPETGQLEIAVDGKSVKLEEVSSKGYRLLKTGEEGNSMLNRFNLFCNNRYRAQYEFVEVPYGEHTIRITLSATQADKKKLLRENRREDISALPEKYNRTLLYIGKL